MFFLLQMLLFVNRMRDFPLDVELLATFRGVFRVFFRQFRGFCLKRNEMFFQSTFYKYFRATETSFQNKCQSDFFTHLFLVDSDFFEATSRRLIENLTMKK